VGFRVVETQGQRFDVARRAVGLEFDQVGAAVPDLPDDGRALVFDPGHGAAQGMLEPQARLPGADLEVEVVLAVPQLLLGRRVNGRRGAVPQPVMYRLTEHGRSLLPLVDAVRAWGRGHIERTLSRAAKAPAS
jgi:hypothetical protein